MINGAHLIVYSDNPDADRSFFRDVLELTHVDVGEGWLIRWLIGRVPLFAVEGRERMAARSSWSRPLPPVASTRRYHGEVFDPATRSPV